jgi:hypothetical protein
MTIDITEQMWKRNGDYTYENWVFTSVRHWGESIAGDWRLDVVDRFPTTPSGIWNSWALKIHAITATSNNTTVDPLYALQSIILLSVYVGGAVIIILGGIYYIRTRSSKFSSSGEHSCWGLYVVYLCVLIFQCDALVFTDEICRSYLVCRICLTDDEPTSQEKQQLLDSPSRKYKDVELAESDMEWQEQARDLPFKELYTQHEIETFVIRFGTALQTLYVPSAAHTTA